MEEKIKAAIYQRVSTPDQETEVQQEECVKEAKKRDLEIYKIYEDVITGKARRLPNRDRMLEDARLGRFQVLLLYHIDRLGRTMRDSNPIYYELKDLGVKIILVKLGFDLSVPVVGEMFFMFLTTFAELEHTFIKERTKDGSKRAFKEKTLFRGRDPHGYYRKKQSKGERGKHDKVVFEKNMEEGKTLLMWKDMRLQGSSLPDISIKTMKLGIRSREGKPFYAASIGSILQNPCYYTGKIKSAEYEQGMDERGKCKRKKDADGKLIKTPEPVEYDCEPYWDEATYRKLTSPELSKRKIRKKRDASGNIIEPVCSSICKGHIYCFRCFRAMWTKPGRPRKDGTAQYYYRCTGKTWDKEKIAVHELQNTTHIDSEKLQAHIEKRTKLCDMENIRIEEIDAKVRDELCLWLLYPRQWLDMYYLHVDEDVTKILKKQIEDKKLEIRRCDRAIDSCYDLVGHEKWSNERLSTKLSKAEEKKSLLEAELGELEARLQRIPEPEKVDALEKQLGPEQERAALYYTLQELPVSEWLEIMGWFFPNGKNDLGRPYGIYVDAKPRMVIDNLDTQEIDNTPPDKVADLYNETSDELEIILKIEGVFNPDNISRLMDRLRSKNGYAEQKDKRYYR